MSERRNSGRDRNPDHVQNEFGAMLEDLRRNKSDFTQASLARAVGVRSKSTIADYETGKSFPNEAVATRLSEKLMERELLEAWHRVNKQREKEKAQRRAAKPQEDGRLLFSVDRKISAPIVIRWFETLPLPKQKGLLRKLLENFRKQYNRPYTEEMEDEMSVVR